MKKHIVFFVMLCLMLGIVVGCQDNTQVVNLYLDDDGDTTTLYSDPADGNSGSSGGQGSSGNQGTEESSYVSVEVVSGSHSRDSATVDGKYWSSTGDLGLKVFLRDLATGRHCSIAGSSIACTRTSLLTNSLFSYVYSDPEPVVYFRKKDFNVASGEVHKYCIYVVDQNGKKLPQCREFVVYMRLK